MQANKRNCAERNEDVGERCNKDKISPVEQALSNALIVGNILEFSSTQDIIRTSLVNRDWCVYSRECLGKKSKKYPVCVQITHDNPCRGLADFNNFLQTITGRGDNHQEKIIFNGIHQAFPDPFVKTHTNCLMNDWKRGDEPLPPEQLPAKIQQTYGKVLGEITFRFLHCLSELPTSCPFVMLIKFIISERAEEILELDFGRPRYEFGRTEDIKYYLLNEDNEPSFLPNLQVFGIKWISTTENFPIWAPALKTLKHFRLEFFNYLNTNGPIQSDFDFPLNVITSVRNITKLDALKSLVNFMQIFRRPSLQRLLFLYDCYDTRLEHTQVYQKFEYSQTFFTIGQLTSTTLTYLECSLSTFAFMASNGFFSRGDAELECKTAFPSLKDLVVTGWMEVDLIDWFSWIDFPKNFPQLQTVNLTIIPPENSSCVQGPHNHVHGSVWTTVWTLVLSQSKDKAHFNELADFEPELTPIPRVLQLFANIRHLDLRPMRLRCDYTDQTFADVINELEILQCLEELSIQPFSLPLLRLDHIFQQKENLSEFKQVVGEANMEKIVVYKSSVLHHKRLKRINIYTKHICRKAYGAQLCYSDQPPGNFIISSHRARLICLYQPGFQISLKTDLCGGKRELLRSVEQCSKNIDTLGLHMKHLEPYLISTTERRFDDVRVFEFWNHSSMEDDSPGNLNKLSIMESTKTNWAELYDDIQESRNLDNQSSVEEALSNALIVGNILEFLSPQDIIRTSMVNRDWCAYSRECLRKKSKKYPVCVQITHVNPCRALADFDNFLQTITGRGDNNQDTIIFNGIHQSYGDLHIKTHTDCLMNDWKRGDEPLLPGELAANIQETYGKVLEKIKFRFIHSLNEIPISCPFAMLIKFIISERAEEILELDFGPRHSAFEDPDDIKYYLQDEGNEPKLFPNLQTFGTHLISENKNISIFAPALTTLKHFQFYLTTYPEFVMPNQSNYDFPLFLISEVRTHLNDVQILVDFIQVLQLSLRRLVFDFYPTDTKLEHTQMCQNLEHCETLFTLGKLTSSTLTYLECTLSTFAFMASNGFFSGVHNELKYKNSFPSLKELNVTGWMEVDLIDWLSWIDFPKNFPQLQTVVLTLVPPKEDSPVNGPCNNVHGCVFTTVSTLVLNELNGKEDQLVYFEFGVTHIPSVLRLFAHIRHLDLSHMKLRYDHTDPIFAHIINELENLPFLEELTIRPISLSLLRLDHIFLQNENLLEFHGQLGNDNMEHILAYKSSVLHHKRLKRINIHGKHSCPKWGNHLCYSDQPPGNFIISSHGARLICIYRPGFKIQLKTDRCRGTPTEYRYYAYCGNYAKTLGLHFEHLQPFLISTTKRRYDDVRVFEFLDHNK